MSKINIYGHSDDLIEIEGDYREEFYTNPDSKGYITLNNGTIIQVALTSECMWRIAIFQPSTDLKIEAFTPATDANNNYSDVLTVSGKMIKPIRFFHTFEEAKKSFEILEIDHIVDALGDVLDKLNDLEITAYNIALEQAIERLVAMENNE